jgi:hypothetical protein
MTLRASSLGQKKRPRKLAKTPRMRETCSAAVCAFLGLFSTLDNFREVHEGDARSIPGHDSAQALDVNDDA